MSFMSCAFSCAGWHQFPWRLKFSGRLPAFAVSACVQCDTAQWCQEPFSHRFPVDSAEEGLENHAKEHGEVVLPCCLLCR